MADEAICSIEECGNPVFNVRGWCQKHYVRWLRHGDPTFLKKRVSATARECSVDGCSKQAKNKGFCNAHYLRQYRHGDPLGGGTSHGAVRDWLDSVAIPYDGNECLAFPFSTDGHGYGRINIDGQHVGAHVYVAERCIGPKPSPEFEVRHSCGKGHEACVTKRHISWGTRLDNVQDAIAHGTFSMPPIGMRGKRR